MGQLCTRAAGASGSQRWIERPSSETTIVHTIPHLVVSQVLRPEIAGFLPLHRIRFRTRQDAQLYMGTLVFIGGPSLNAMNITDEDLKHAHTFPNLTELNAGSRSMGPECRWIRLGHIARHLPHLERLNISGCSGNLSDVTLLMNLKRLDASHCSGINMEGLAQLHQLTKLSQLVLSGCSGVDAPALAEVAKIRWLEHLAIDNCQYVDEKSVAEVAKLEWLSHLDLSGCRSVDTAALTALAANLKQLTSLLVGGCNVDMTGLAEIAKFKRLTRLDVSGCENVSSFGLCVVAMGTQLTHLNVKGCRLVDATGLVEVTKLAKVTHIVVDASWSPAELDQIRHVRRVVPFWSHH